MSEYVSHNGYFAIRNSVALEDETDMRCLLLRGREAFKLLDQVCPCNVFLQNGQMRHTILLDENAVPFADIYVCRHRDDAYLLGYWGESVDLVNWMKDFLSPNPECSVTDMNESNCFLTLNGPYAWELCAKAVGTEILGMPYLSVMPLRAATVFRAGITGEYGYHLMVPGDRKREWKELIQTTGKPFDLAFSDRTEREQCSLENFFFDLFREGQYRLTPPELQLQWRLSREKTGYPGFNAILNLREKGWDRRLTCFTTKLQVRINDEIFYKKEMIGQVISAGYSPLRSEFVGKALIRKPFWHAGLKCFTVNSQDLETISSPAIDNLSIHVNPNINSYFTRKGNRNEQVHQ